MVIGMMLLADRHDVISHMMLADLMGVEHKTSVMKHGANHCATKCSL
jgi:hypothetical protein